MNDALRNDSLDGRNKVESSDAGSYPEGADGEAGRGYWWVNVNPKEWSFSKIAVGESQPFTLRDEKESPRRIQGNFLKAKLGENVICYESTPKKRVTAIGCISAEQDGKELSIEKVEDLSEQQITYEALKECPELNGSEPFRNGLQGTLFKLEKEQYDRIIDMIRGQKPVPMDVPIDDCKNDGADRKSAEMVKPDAEEPACSRNTIWYGAPGTGKSYRLNDLLQKSFAGRYERVTFYADYLHSQFVGSYKPVTVPDKGVEYRFRPGPFVRALIHALNDPAPYALVIEELNRAEAASVFGDVFQLLDRGENGDSEYPITVSEDLREYLSDMNDSEVDAANHLTEDGRKALVRLTKTDDCSRIGIPSNLYILATMNSADQGVFPLDTAFKRRWDFEYVGIDDGASCITDKTWNKNRKEINKSLHDADIPEDKQMGPFFLGNKTLTMDIRDGDHHDDPFDKAMKNKVIMYLFEDAAKYRPEVVFNTDKLDGKPSLQTLFAGWDKDDYGIFRGLEKQRNPVNDEPDADEDAVGDSVIPDDSDADREGEAR